MVVCVREKAPAWLRRLTKLSIIAPVFMLVVYTLPILPEQVGRAALYMTSMSYLGDISVANETYKTYSDDASEISWEHDMLFEGIDTTLIGTSDIPYEEETDTIVTPDAAADTPTAPKAPEPVVETAVKPQNAGNILRKFYQSNGGTAFVNLNPGFLKNCTKLSNASIIKEAEKPPAFKILADGTPEVLIMHTHATEGYQPVLSQWYDKSNTSRTTDNSKNTTRVGDEIAKQLTDAGIGVIQDKTLHDYPSYNGAYERSAETVKRILKENPTIKVVLDVHRDAIQQDASTMVAPVVNINGKDCAQVMIISGCDDGTMNMPKYMENLKFSSALQRQMETDYPGLARPILFDYRKYNQNLTTGSILLEMGGHANTLEEAIYCGELVGKSLAQTLLSLS